MAGIGLYDTFVHVDSRMASTRWDLRKGTKNLKIPTYTGKHGKGPSNELDWISINIEGKVIDEKGFIKNSKSYVPLRALGESLGFDIGFNKELNKPTINGSTVDLDKEVVNGKTYYGVRDVLRLFNGISIKWNAALKQVEINR